MKRMMWSVAMLVAVVLPAGVVAQSGTMAKGDKMDKMDKMEMKDASYTGCIAAGMATGTFMLTQVSADAMGKNAMTPESIALASSSVDLSKHLGHKVAITGSPAHGKMDAMGKDTKDGMAKDAPAFTVKSLKMVSASCS